MKRPGPLPPRQAVREEDEPDVDETPPRSRIASVLPFGRGKGRVEDGPSDDTGTARESDGDRVSHDDAGRDSGADALATDGGRFALWRAAHRRRRAERAEVRRFTVRSRRRRIVWLSAIGAVVLLAVGTIGSAYSPLFAVHHIKVVGASSLDPAVVAEALSEQVDRPLPLVDHDEIHAALTSFPRIETYSVESRPPHELVIRITERTAVAAIATDAGFTAVDAAGVALATTPEQPEGMPIAEVDEGLDSSVFAAVGQVLRSLPSDMTKRMSVIRATSPEDIEFDLPDGGGVTVVWGSADGAADKLEVLTAAFTATPPDTVSRYDVSSAGVLVVE